MTKRVMIGAALGVLALAGCSTHSSVAGTSSGQEARAGTTTSAANRTTGVVHGRLLLVGGPSPGRPRPATSGTVRLSGPSSETVSVDGRGLFEITIAGGTYQVTGASPEYGDGTYLCRSPGPVTVNPARTSNVPVYCQLR